MMYHQQYIQNTAKSFVPKLERNVYTFVYTWLNKSIYLCQKEAINNFQYLIFFLVVQVLPTSFLPVQIFVATTTTTKVDYGSTYFFLQISKVNRINQCMASWCVDNHYKPFFLTTFLVGKKDFKVLFKQNLIQIKFHHLFHAK